jgi:Tat protein translocase TatB subunit
MFNVGGGEIIVILLIALIVLGPDKLPSAARQAGKYLHEFRQMSQAFQHEIRNAMDVADLTTPPTSLTKPWSPGGPTPIEPNPLGTSAIEPAAIDTTVVDPADIEPTAAAGVTESGGAESDGAESDGAGVELSKGDRDGIDFGIGGATSTRPFDIDVDGPSTSFS